jgi:serine/threonine protein kinase
MKTRPKRRRFDVLVCWRLDRLGRNLKHLITLLEEFQALGIAFVSFAEGIDALKVLPDSFVHDAERVARFRREAQVLASLNHPHIGAIHGFKDANGVTALVLELVEGPTVTDGVPIPRSLPGRRPIPAVRCQTPRPAPSTAVHGR